MRRSSKRRLIKISVVVISLLLIASIIYGIIWGVDQAKRNKAIDNIEQIEISTRAKNVILMIGDGMGVNHIEAAKTYFGQMNLEDLAVADGKISTFSKSHWTTDSAAAATALATGKKTINKQIAKYMFKDIKSISEYALEANKSVGVIATEGLNGATPASFSGHAGLRNSTNKIIDTQIETGITLMLGAEKALYDKKRDKIEAKGYSYINSLSNTEELSQKEKIFGTFEEISTGEHTEDKPTLANLSGFALDFLSAKSGDNGFFLMIEGSHIDKRSHDNDMDGMLKHIKGFDDAVKTVVDWANAEGDTMVVVTADHETGDLRYNGESKENINNSLFHSGGHTSQDVRIFFYGIVVTKEEYQGIKIDNTQVFNIVYQALGI